MPRYPRTLQRPLRSRFRWIYQALLVSILLFLLFRWPGLPAKPSLTWLFRSPPDPQRVAYATLLLPSSNTTDEDPNSDADVYFTSTRILAYQLLHAKSTKSTHNIPFLVLVTPEVAYWKRYQLTLEGCTVIPIEKVSEGSAWLNPMADRWRDLMTKLRLSELVDYDKILFLDGDTFVLHPMDDIFLDPAATPVPILHQIPILPDEAPLPKHYLFASSQEVLHTSHPFPPPPWPKFNAGFFMLRPSMPLFNYYLSLLKIENKFDSTYMEQELLNYAHREWGNMPWARLGSKWNIRLPNAHDVRAGVRSVHGKFWEGGDGVMELEPTDQGLRKGWRGVKKEMEAWHGSGGHIRRKKVV